MDEEQKRLNQKKNNRKKSTFEIVQRKTKGIINMNVRM